MNSTPPNPGDEPPQRLDPALAAHIRDGNIIAAIKRYRELHPGAGLAEAKAAVEQLQAGIAPSKIAQAAPSAASTEAAVLAHLRKGEKIAAIKEYRELHRGAGLADAKQAVEEIARRHNIPESALKTSGCFIATEVFGGADVWPVTVLRYWRDTVLTESRPGRGLIHIYNGIGPVLASLARRWPWLKNGCRPWLARIANHLSRRHHFE